ncbi:unnamed protein product [Schistocephalus solidus]|uniref:Uncharacterized protein n=1 Tax=Schistocephalus solidus TaxID=70667 RepID=A0A183TMJ5_SCHSO|nr:unnamed protein product [Schistocephalus solidus]
MIANLCGISNLTFRHPYLTHGELQVNVPTPPTDAMTPTSNPEQRRIIQLAALDTTDQKIMDERVNLLRALFAQLTPSNWRLAGLLFHHLKRDLICALTINFRFQVANMMEFVDNKWLTKVVEVAIDRASDIFGSTNNFSMRILMKELKDAAATREQQTQKEMPSITPPKSPRDDFYIDCSAKAAEASPSTRSAAASPRSSTSSSSETRQLTQAPVPTTTKTVTTKPPQQQLQQPKSTTTSEPASAVSGLKRLVSAKAYNIQQHFQQFTGSSSNASSSSNTNSKSDPRSPSSGVLGLVIGQPKVTRSKSSRASSSRNSTPDKHQQSTAFTVSDCSYIDNGKSRRGEAEIVFLNKSCE